MYLNVITLVSDVCSKQRVVVLYNTVIKIRNKGYGKKESFEIFFEILKDVG